MNDARNTLEGSVSVYFTLIITSVLAFFLALFALGRAMLFRYGVREDMDLAAFSVLAEYQEDWAQEYGLYMVPLSRVESGMEFFMEANRHHMLMSYTIADLKIEETQTLAETEVLREEISSFMEERGALSLLSKMLTLLSGLKNEEGIEEAEESLKTAPELIRIQEQYAMLVKAVYGIRDDGTQDPYGVNTFLSLEDPLMPSEAELIDVLDVLLEEAEEGESLLESISDEQLSTLELTLSAAEEIHSMATEGKVYAQNILAILSQIDNDSKEAVLEKLPFTEEEMTRITKILDKDEDILDDVETNMTALLEELPEEEAEGVFDAIVEMTSLLNYDRSIVLPYEVSEGTRALDIASVLAFLRGYPLSSLELFPDEDKDLKGAAAYADAEGENETLSDPLKFMLSKDLTLLSLGEDIKDSYLLNEYLIGMYRSFRESLGEKNGEKTKNLRGETKDRRFFNNEVEYVLAGHPNEYKNVNEVRLKILGIRTLLNAIYILSDPVKVAEIENLSHLTGGILLPGIGDAVFFAAILSCWSLGEAICDYRILTEGGNVPLWKDEDSFHTDLSSLLTGVLTEETQKEGRGLSYEEYEKILLFLLPMETRLKRTQTLLSVNHRFFSLEEAAVAFTVNGSASGDREISFRGRYGYVEVY